MRRVIIVIAFLTFSTLVAHAQYTIEDIRKSYASVKEYIAQMSGEFPTDGIPHEYYHLNVEQNLPGTGPHHEHVWMYFGEQEVDAIYPPHYLWFTTKKYNFAVREYYEVKQRQVDEKTYREVYNGPTIPEAYQETTGMLQGNATVNLRLFKEIDNVSYPYTE